MYALFLRHGWAIKKDDKEAVRLLVLATDMVLSNHRLDDIVKNNPLGDCTLKPLIIDAGSLQRANHRKSSATVSQLVMAIYELGISFKMGWGVPKDKVKAAYYLDMAANLGDMDAQIELGH